MERGTKLRGVVGGEDEVVVYPSGCTRTFRVESDGDAAVVTAIGSENGIAILDPPGLLPA